MLQGKLMALDYHNPAGFNCNDEPEFRNLIVWLEDQKIRHYKIEGGGNLRNSTVMTGPNSLKSISEMLTVLSRFKIAKKQLTGVLV
uniref:RNA transcription, translation and transport factor protein n=1 Tax=Ailuropoda melanoleuca TaxID=9646 RepID=A0A7N5JL10_AILME